MSKNITLKSNPEQAPELKKTLKKRHLLMMSLGGTIGTGLFIGIAQPLHTVGPLGTIISYLLAGMIMIATMFCLGELSCAFPHSGSFQHYALMFLKNPVWSYTIGWLYWLSWVFSLAADITASGLIAHHFFPLIPVYVLSFIVLLLLMSMNLLSANLFGECEYWLSAIKVFAIIAFIFIGVAMIFHIHSETHAIPSLKSAQGWFPHGVWSIFMCMTIVAYSFQGVEMIGNAAGETSSPQKILSKVISGIALRIILFYALAIIVLALVYPYDSPVDGSSPFVWVFAKMGLPNAATIMDIVILSAAISAANSAIYASSRMLWSMSHDGFAPKCFGTVSKRGIPAKAIYLTIAISLVSLLSKFISAEKFYLYLIASTGQVGCLAWIVIAWCQQIFRKKYNAGEYPPETMSFKSPFSPWLAWFAIIMNALVIVGTWFSDDGLMMLIAEVGLIIIILLCYYFGYYRKHRQQIKKHPLTQLKSQILDNHLKLKP